MTKSKTHGGMKLKKFLAVLCLICLLFSCASVTAMAAGKGMIESSSCEAEKGETVEVYLTLKENPGIWGTKIKVKYDDSALTLKSVKAGSVFSESELTYSEKMNKNPYVIVATGNTAKNKTTTGKIVTLKFAVSKEAKDGKYPIVVDVVQSINTSGKDVSMSSVDGNITVEKEQVTPTDPTEPSEPDDPTKPTEPSKPTEPDDNDDPTKPGDSDDPTEPGDNEDPTKPGDNDDPTELGDNDESTESGDGEGNKPSDDEGNNASEGDENAAEGEDSTGTGDNSVLLPFACIMIAALAIFVAMFKRRRS